MGHATTGRSLWLVATATNDHDTNVVVTILEDDEDDVKPYLPSPSSSSHYPTDLDVTSSILPENMDADFSDLRFIYSCSWLGSTDRNPRKLAGVRTFGKGGDHLAAKGKESRVQCRRRCRPIKLARTYGVVYSSSVWLVSPTAHPFRYSHGSKPAGKLDEETRSMLGDGEKEGGGGGCRGGPRVVLLLPEGGPNNGPEYPFRFEEKRVSSSSSFGVTRVTRTGRSHEQEERPVLKERKNGKERESVQGVDGGAMHAIYQHRTDNEVPRRLPVVKDNNDDNDDDDDDDRSAGVTLDVAQTAILSPFFSSGSC
ncbi:hypothetical protein M0804_010470 [Polistes exclamans]|nr:hypothetical protein M0804_010470 [Polistes exclamans]